MQMPSIHTFAPSRAPSACGHLRRLASSLLNYGWLLYVLFSVCFFLCSGMSLLHGLQRGKEMKRSTLLELVDYVNAQSGQKIFTVTLPESERERSIRTDMCIENPCLYQFSGAARTFRLCFYISSKLTVQNACSPPLPPLAPPPFFYPLPPRRR